MLEQRHGATSKICGALILIGLFIGVLSAHILPWLLLALSIVVLVGAVGTLNPLLMYVSLYGSFWLLLLAFFVLAQNWWWFLAGLGISILLGILKRPLLATFFSMGLLKVYAYKPPTYALSPKPSSRKRSSKNNPHR
ncbi:hypothetical protein [Tengunoibacter tsumagoiensis]|uniref:Uncharacterized protein n=1 Tax=Tengunoibacter tsumagoiensis TaxID=2014871 RepID=A0A401ZZW4_9CHLR|nr:hypothetical protein [Tengunoibacter tsumagoiensis]GCE12366.1 hypothetical protein KTT_22250 [Tengunoibacter tsumagoiensis]